MLNPETKSELLSIIDKLAELEKRRNEVKEQQYQVRDRINVIRAKNLVEISFAKDNKEKPIYPSEQVREAALIIALDKDMEFRSLREKLRASENKLQEILIEHGRLSNRKTLLMFEAGLVTPPSSEPVFPAE
jgi:beta-N-acetylglucosaminidase